jgi:protein-tyrosine-phosphatase/DNA-binding transcriptional ArsR family regulator
VEHPPTLERRVTAHRALGDPTRLAIVDELVRSDRSPLELQRLTATSSNLLAHHLDVLESAGLVHRGRSTGDARRRYVKLRDEAMIGLVPRPHTAPTKVMFVCTRNSARSQLAAALWRQLTGAPADSAGTDPATRVHPGAVAAAKRANLELSGYAPHRLNLSARLPRIVITVCDQAHESLPPHPTWLHWSIADPVPIGTAVGFDATVDVLRRRIQAFVTDITSPAAPSRAHRSGQ